MDEIVNNVNITLVKEMEERKAKREEALLAKRIARRRATIKAYNKNRRLKRLESKNEEA